MIDQSNEFAPQSVRNVSDIGQSFTPTLTGIDFATFYITSLATLVTLRLYSGEGFSGALLGAAGPFGLASTNPLAPTSYSFASTISLVPGQLYTLRLTAMNGVFASPYSSANPYAGGDIFDDVGSRPPFDLRFAEASTPSPSPARGRLWRPASACLAVLCGSEREARWRSFDPPLLTSMNRPRILGKHLRLGPASSAP